MSKDCIFLAEIKGSDFPGQCLSHRTTNPVVSAQCLVPSVPPAVRPLRFGAGFGCKIVRGFSLRKLSPSPSSLCTVSPWAMTDHRSCSQARRGIVLKRIYCQLDQGTVHHLQLQQGPGGVCDIHKYVYTHMHAYEYISCGYLAANGVISKGQCVK